MGKYKKLGCALVPPWPTLTSSTGKCCSESVPVDRVHVLETMPVTYSADTPAAETWH